MKVKVSYLDFVYILVACSIEVVSKFKLEGKIIIQSSPNLPMSDI